MARITSKWPLLLATGKQVTPEQADDILLRTCQWLGGNDREWETTVGLVLGIDQDRYGLDWKSERAWRERIGSVDLHYFGNARIYSPYVGGPHGWCDWDGRIGCGNYNLGKWPAVAEVEEDLAVIAAAWPFLDMRVQLVEDEGDGTLCGEWRVAGGEAMETEPGPRIDQPELDMATSVAAIVFVGSGRERGVTRERLVAAYARVLASSGGS